MLRDCVGLRPITDERGLKNKENKAARNLQHNAGPVGSGMIPKGMGNNWNFRIFRIFTFKKFSSVK